MTAGRPARIRLAMGPVRDQVSWRWVGEDPATLLSDEFDVELFDSVEEPPAADVIFVVKVLPSRRFLRRARARGSRLVYVPVDGLISERMISKHGRELRAFDGFGLHCGRLARHLPTEGRVCVAIDHWNRFGLEAVPEFKEEGPLLWVGACEHIPRVLRWLNENSLPHPVRILTNLDVEASRNEARRLAEEIGFDLHLTPRTTAIGDHECAQWSEQTQRQWMEEAKAAFDIKGQSFLQRHKPPTKAQQFVASGIPFAINRDAYAFDYYEALGFQLATPDDPARWLSKAYFDELRAFAPGHAATLTLERVAGDYARLVRSVHERPRGLRERWAGWMARA